jgi:C1A family cysteine protease
MSKILISLLFGFISFGANAQTTNSVDLRPYLSPVRNQGQNRNTCSAFEASALAEYLIYERTGQSRLLSENFNYWAAKSFELTTPYLQNGYAHVDGMAGFLAVKALENGVMLETDWPYQDQNGISAQVPGCSSDAGPVPTECFTGTPPAGAPVQPLRFQTTFIPREQIGDYMLAYRKPVVMNIMWYFAAAKAKGVVRLPTTNEVNACLTTGQGCGGHVILLVGYYKAQHLFIFRNSWGPQWGSKGYGFIPEQYILQNCELCHQIGKTGLSPDDADMIQKGTQGVTATLLE